MSLHLEALLGVYQATAWAELRDTSGKSANCAATRKRSMTVVRLGAYTVSERARHWPGEGEEGDLVKLP